MPLQRRHAFNTRALADAAKFVRRDHTDLMDEYFKSGSVTAPGAKPPYLALLPGHIKDRAATASIMAMNRLSPFSWVIRATRADRIEFTRQGKSCYARGVPAQYTKVMLADYYQPVPHEYFPEAFMAKQYRVPPDGNFEWLNACIVSPDITSLENHVHALSGYIRPNATGELVDYAVIAFQLKDALRLGARLYKDLTAVVADAYMLALPTGTRLLADVKARGNK